MKDYLMSYKIKNHNIKVTFIIFRKSKFLNYN